MSEQTVAILSPGAVGGFLAAVLWRKGIVVTCVAREATAEVMARGGIRLESATFGDLVARPRVVTQLDREHDVLVVTTKATGLYEALGRVSPELVSRTMIVPLLNGIEHLEALRSRYGRRVVAATIGHVELKRLAPNHVVHSTASVRIELASDRDVEASRLADIACLLSEAGVPAEVRKNEAEVVWGKLVRLNAIACTTSASGQPMGVVRVDPWWRTQLEGCVQEGIAVAAAEGVTMDLHEVMAFIDNLPAGLTSSMSRDIEAGKPSELDAIAGAVVRAGAGHGLACPVIERLIARIQSRMVPCQSSLR
ncbi:MAG: ketopantoate reductase family protein [Candidatus Omnitrophica bacterium]|nr:ketopantoate reductase family protein [Candidatus Omnitrophota bacterium]